MNINLLGIREVIVDLLVEYVEDDIQKVPSKQTTIRQTTMYETVVIIIMHDPTSFPAKTNGS
ncbi:hypothetical protein HanRHA438_Chr11g0515091 [Helianthus annuus]|nr:hypothetical protein HanIR_Chr11g0540891 [Helianthus annuus]KAJ0871668.1 hypothetical protein HanRHA438_Chr11g0515091 [Helianthus annuus]